jgi:hypothetical protein
VAFLLVIPILFVIPPWFSMILVPDLSFLMNPYIGFWGQ